MKQSLPSHPSIEHLKKQAKRLLKSARESEPAALRRLSEKHPRYAAGIKEPQKIALQEVQLVVAREHGHTSWPQLMASLKGLHPVDPVDSSKILLYTNGGSAIELLNLARVPGEKQEWIEALHDGPVPLTATREELYRIRARHFTNLGWTSAEGAMERFAKRDEPLSRPSEYEELQLWFEHDLYDQLQLIQLLDHLAEIPGWMPKATLLQFDRLLGYLRPEEIKEARPSPVAITQAHLDLAQRAWIAFRAPSPSGLLAVAQEEAVALPFLPPALLRLCQEFPSVENGLGRTEAQLLSAVAGGRGNPQEIFRHNQDQEEAPFMGDSSFYGLIQRFTLGNEPLLAEANGERFQTPGEVGYTELFKNQRLHLTATGEKVLRGETDRLACLPAPYWIGGVELQGRASPRWDGRSAEFRFPD